MQTKSINQAIRKKINEWIDSIADTELQNDLKKSVLVSGGSIASLFLGESVNDFDIYIQERPVLLALTKYYCKGIGGVEILDGAEKDSLIDQYRESFSREDFLKHPGHRASALRNLRPEQIKLYINHGGGYKCDIKVDQDGSQFKYQPSYFSPNAISLTDQIQIVIRFWGTPDEIHKTFDYIHATNYWTHEKGVVLNLESVESLLTKTLRYQGSLYPLTSVIRSKKFIKRGFNINAGELLKMMFQISLLNLEDLDVLEDQLIGIDVAYFEVLIQALRDNQERNPEFKITPEYFNNLIDIVFNRTEESE